MKTLAGTLGVARWKTQIRWRYRARQAPRSRACSGNPCIFRSRLDRARCRDDAHFAGLLQVEQRVDRAVFFERPLRRRTVELHYIEIALST
jgi:hypothetical protein